MRNFPFFCLLWLLICCCRQQEKLDIETDLPGNWRSEKVLVSGVDISNITTYEISFNPDKSLKQVVETVVNGQTTKTEKTGVWSTDGQKIVLSFNWQIFSENWVVKILTADDLQVEFSDNGENFAIDFQKK